MQLNPGNPTSDPSNFPGNPNPTAQAPDPGSAPAGASKPGTSAGTGALTPSSAGSASPYAESVSSSQPTYSVVETPDGTRDAYATDAKGPQKLFTIRLPKEDADHALAASGATYDKALGSYENVPENVVKALGSGRPTPVEYWKEQYDASEEEAVVSANARLYLDGKLSREDLMNVNHVPTLKAQLAERPDMAWFGRVGIVADMIQHPVEGLEHAGEKVVGTIANWVGPIKDIAAKAVAGGAAGLAVASPGVLLPPPANAMVLGAGITIGAQLGMLKGFYDLGRGQAAAHWVAQGIPDEVVKKHAPAAGVINAAMMWGGFKAMSLLGKAAFLDGLLESKMAQRALAHWALGSAETGGVMAVQSAINALLNHIVAEVAHRPDLIEDPKTAALNALEAGVTGLMGGAALGIGAIAARAALFEGFKQLTPEEQASPEGKKTLASIKRADEKTVVSAVKEKLDNTKEPAAEKAVTEEKEVKPIYDLTRKELDTAHKEALDTEHSIDEKILGDEGAKEWNKLHKRLNSSDPERAKIAQQRINEIEDSLPKEKVDALYGIGEGGYSAEDLAQYHTKLGELDASSPEALGQSLARAITDVGDETDPAKMNPRQQIAYAQIREAARIAKEKGWNTKSVSDAAVKAAGARFSDPEDAAFMLRRFAEENPPKAPEESSPASDQSPDSSLQGSREQTLGVSAPPSPEMTTSTPEGALTSSNSSLESNIADLTKNLNAAGITDPKEVKAILAEYGLYPGETGEGAQSLATDVTQEAAKPENMGRQTLGVYAALKNISDPEATSYGFTKPDPALLQKSRAASAVVSGYFSGEDLGPKEVKSKQLEGPKTVDKTPGLGERQYVPERSLGNVPIGDAKLTANEVLQRYSEIRNEWLTRGNQLVEEIKRAVPDEKQRQGLFWYRAAEGDKAVLESAAADPELAQYRAQIEAALDLSPEAKAAAEKIDRYYAEAGATAQELGTVKSLVENFQNRLYVPEKKGQGLGMGNGPLGQTTRHARQRVFDSEFDAARYGKTFATTDAAAALGLYNHEMATVNTNRAVADGLVAQGIAAWKQEVPEGWAPVGQLEKQTPVVLKDGSSMILRHRLVAPEGIANGLRAISEQDWTQKIPGVKEFQRLQGTVKTGLLSWSFFHHFTFLMQAVAERDVSSLLNMGKMDATLQAPEFKMIEQDGAAHGLETAMAHTNMDVMHDLTRKDGLLGELANKPVIKEVLAQTDKNSNFLFGKMQRYFKGLGYGSRVVDWVANHPNATEAETTEAKRGIARHINATWGGLNWTAMGMNKSHLSILRSIMLAPDWAISSGQVLAQAIGDKGTAGIESRKYIATALAAGFVGTEAINKMLTGHFTDGNKPGHQMEIEVAPDVYVSLLRGGIGEIAKFASMVAESGAEGIPRYAMGKLAPFTSLVVSLLANVAYTGKPITKRNSGPIAGTFDVLKYVLEKTTPTPIAIVNLIHYLMTPNPTPLGAGVLTTGVGRYSKPPKDKKGAAQDVIPE